MSFLKDVSLSGAIKDLRYFTQQSPKERIIPGILALLIPGLIIYVFIIDSKINTAAPPGPKVIYFESWPLSRTDDEILADRWAIQCLKNKAEAERRESMKKLGRMSGMDVEKIEREAAAAKAARGEKDIELPDGITC